tara:strand:+ start:25033 stop:25653 length:621 start_codon:yes stop_codon:yes gene_type:complete
MARHKIVEYYRPAPAGDANVGGGYGTTKPKGLGSEYSREQTYPYTEESVGDEEDFLLDIEEFIDQHDLSDFNLSNRLTNKTGSGYVTDDPVRGQRADRASFVSNQRLDISELNRIPVRKGSMSPIPLRSLYKGFSGPAAGGTSTSFAYTTAPGRKTGTQYGTSRAPMPIEDDGIRVFNADEIPDPSVRAIMKTRNKIKKVLSEVGF